MSKAPKAPAAQAIATRADVLRLLGDLDDETVAAVLQLAPTLMEIEEAAVWLDGEGSTAFRRGHPQNARLTKILELVDTDEEPRYLR